MVKKPHTLPILANLSETINTLLTPLPYIKKFTSKNTSKYIYIYMHTRYNIALNASSFILMGDLFRRNWS